MTPAVDAPEPDEDNLDWAEVAKNWERQLRAMEEQRDEARQWARHGYEIGQRHCSWSDHGVAPGWLTEGWPPHIESCDSLKQMAEIDQAYCEARVNIQALYDQWLAAGPPPLGVSLARWQDQRLIEFRGIIPPDLSRVEGEE